MELAAKPCDELRREEATDLGETISRGPIAVKLSGARRATGEGEYPQR
jgi:hypothetical protein